MVEIDPFFKENVKNSFIEAKKHADKLEKEIEDNKHLISLQNKQIDTLLKKIEDLRGEITKSRSNNEEKAIVPEEEIGSIHSFIHSFNSYSHDKSGLKTVVENIESLLKTLTKQELLAFLTIYQLEEDQKSNVTYIDVSKKMGLSEGCIRTYISSLIQKGAPIIKKKHNNKTVFLSILDDFRNLNYKERIITAYYGSDPGQKRLF